MRENWTYKKLGDYIKEYSVKNKAGKDIPVYSVTNSQGFCKEYFSKEIASQDKTSYKIVPYGFFAFNPSRINVGSIDWQHKEEQVIVSPLYNVFSVSESVLQPYLLYYLKSPATIKYIDAIATGTVRLNLKLSMLKDFSIPLPSLSEQQAIVSELDKINELISLKKAQLDDLDALAQSIFYDMFGAPIENEKGWEVKKLGEVVNITAKLVDPNQQPYCNQYHVGPANIIGGTGEIVDCLIAKDENLISGKYAFKSGVVLYSKIRPNLNKVAMPSFDGVCSADMYPLSMKANVVNMYIMRLLMTKEFLKYAVNCSGRARMPKINREALFDFRFYLPPLSLQQSFAKRIELIEQQKAQISSTIKDLETLLASRMQYWFD